MEEELPRLGQFGWNNAPEWETYMESLEPDIKALASKYTSDIGLREDVAQNARIALLQTWPEQVDVYLKYIDGEIDEQTWNRTLHAYCRQVIRNTILPTLQNWSQGPWYVGRTRRYLNSETGEYEQRRLPPRYVSMGDDTEPTLNTWFVNTYDESHEEQD